MIFLAIIYILSIISSTLGWFINCCDDPSAVARPVNHKIYLTYILMVGKTNLAAIKPPWCNALLIFLRFLHLGNQMKHVWSIHNISTPPLALVPLYKWNLELYLLDIKQSTCVYINLLTDKQIILYWIRKY